MTSTTFKYITPDAPSLNNSDSAEVDDITLFTRKICDALSLPADKTRRLFQAGSASGQNIIRVSDDLYPTISAELSASETASVVSSAPSGFAESSAIARFQPDPNKSNLIGIGDSLTAATGSGQSPLINGSLLKQCLDAVQTLTEDEDEPEGRVWYNDTWHYINIALGESSWGNTDAVGGAADYPRRMDLAYDQRFETLNFNCENSEDIYLHFWLGTNDLAYDVDLTGAQAWARASSRIDIFAAKFPSAKIIFGTPIRRSESATLNGRLKEFKDEVLADYQNHNIDYVVEYDQADPDFDLETGDTTNTTLYSGDQVHCAFAGYTALGNYLKTEVIDTL